jgi:hypothetical protein
LQSPSSRVYRPLECSELNAPVIAAKVAVAELDFPLKKHAKPTELLVRFLSAICDGTVGNVSARSPVMIPLTFSRVQLKPAVS